MGDVKIDIPCG